MTPAKIWHTHLLRLVLGIMLTFSVIAAIAVFLIVVVLWPVVGGVADIVTVVASMTPHGAEFIALIGTWPSRILFCFVQLESLCVVALVFGSLSRMLRDAARGSPFSMVQVSRLRVIAACYGFSLVSRFVVPLIAPPALRHWLASNHWSFNIGDLIIMLVALALAEVFQEGLRLREEVALTV